MNTTGNDVMVMTRKHEEGRAIPKRGGLQPRKTACIDRKEQYCCTEVVNRLKIKEKYNSFLLTGTKHSCGASREF